MSSFSRQQLIEFMKALQYQVKIEHRPKGHSQVTFIEDHGVFKGQTHTTLRWDRITPLAVANIITQEGYLREQINEAICKVFKSKNLVKLDDEKAA